MSAGYFVAGNDTGVGKKLISSALVYGFAQRGLRAAGMKPVAAGCVLEEGVWLSDDVKSLRAASNVELPTFVVNPYACEPPIAPHIAAKWVGERISLSKITTAFAAAQSRVDMLVVEGVGGFCVPLNEHEDTADMAVALGLPVVLVVGVRLGCLSHALLTAEAIRTRGLTLAGWVANHIEPGMLGAAENVLTLRERLGVPLISEVSFSAFADFRVVAGLLDYDRLCENN